MYFIFKIINFVQTKYISMKQTIYLKNYHNDNDDGAQLAKPFVDSIKEGYNYFPPRTLYMYNVNLDFMLS